MAFTREQILAVDEPADLYPQHLEEMKRKTGEALDASQFDSLIVHTGLEVQEPFRDSHAVVRINPGFSQWTGGLYRKNVAPASNGVARLDYTHGHAVVFEPGKAKPKLYVQSDQANRWLLQAGVPENADQYFDVVVAATQEELWEKLRKALPRRNAFLGPENMPNVPWRRDRSLPHLVHTPEALLDHLNWNRLKKTLYELACIVQANRKTALGHRAARELFVHGSPFDGSVSEGSVVSAFLAGARTTGTDVPYKPIAGFGPHGSILHYFEPNYGVTEGNSLVIDAAAQHSGYAADVTCTYVREGVSREFENILHGLDGIQRKLVAMVKPGVDFQSIQREMCLQVAQLLIDAGVIINCDAQGAAELGLSAAFIIHSFGHTIGAHVHDAGQFQVDASGRSMPPNDDAILAGSGFVRSRGPLSEDSATTVEPGIYPSPLLRQALAKADEKRTPANRRSDKVRWSLQDKLAKDGGMRLESNVAVLTDGPFDITREFLPELTNV